MEQELDSAAITDLVNRITAGDRRALAKAITLAESSKPQAKITADALISKLPAADRTSKRIGITGAPGVGKSTFINSFGRLMCEKGSRLAVLAVDPSSRNSGGSILGDKTRMQDIAHHPKAFVRPSPSGLEGGTVAYGTHASIRLCEAAGYDTILVETVGAGQMDLSVATVTDIFVLLIAPSGGDSLQALKRGTMEQADIVIVTKADGDLKLHAERTATSYSESVQLIPPKAVNAQPQKWQTRPVITYSTHESKSVSAAAQTILELLDNLANSGQLDEIRQKQTVELVDSILESIVRQKLADSDKLRSLRASLLVEVTEGRSSAREAAERISQLLSIDH